MKTHTQLVKWIFTTLLFFILVLVIIFFELISGPPLAKAENNLFDEKITKEEKKNLTGSMVGLGEALKGLHKLSDAFELLNLVNEFKKGNCQKFLAIEGSAKQGDAKNQWVLADLYRNGLCVKKNEEQTLYWIKKSASQDYKEAIFELAISYLEGIGTKLNPKQAVIWVKKGAKMGDSRLQKRLAQLYEQGNGVTQNYSLAMKWYEKSANSGNLEAAGLYAFSLATGKLGELNFEKGLEWALYGAEKGNHFSQVIASIILIIEETDTFDPIQAHKWANLGNQTNNEEIRKVASSLLLQITKLLTSNELITAQSLALNWKPKVTEVKASVSKLKKSSLPKIPDNTADKLTRVEAKSKLLKLGVPIDRDAFFRSVEEDNLGIFKLFHKAGANLETKKLYPKGITALYDAVDFGSKKIYRYLMEKKVEINIINQASGMTPLVRAISWDRWDMVEELLESGADASLNSYTKRNILKPSALAYILMSDKPEITMKILESGGSVNEQYTYNQIPIMLAVKKDSIDNIKILIKFGSNLNAMNQFGKTPLHFALEATPIKIEILKLLLENGADPKISKIPVTPLYMATYFGNPMAVNLLLQYGADHEESYFFDDEDIPMFLADKILIDLVKFGGTPLMLASAMEHASVVKILLEQGSDRKKVIFVKSGKLSALSIAKQNGNKVIVDMLETGTQ